MRHHLTLFALVLSGGCIYNLSYLRASFESTMLEVFRLTDGELGTISALLGIASLLCYFPGGWLADRFSSRILLTLSCLFTGLGGLYMSTLAQAQTSQYTLLLYLHIFWAITTILTYWAALIKATQDWGGARQGFAFGLLDSGRGLIKVILTTLSIYIFSQASTKADGLSQAILVHAIACIVAGVACWLWIQTEDHTTDTSLDASHTRNDGKRNENEEEKESEKTGEKHSTVDDLLTLARLPSVWLMGMIVFAAYTAYWSTFTFARYAEESYQLSETNSAYVSTISMWIRAVMPIIAGLIADRLGRGRVVILSFLVTSAALSIFMLVPGSPDLTWMLVSTVVLISLGIFSLRGVYFALIKGTDIPAHLSGLAVGVISLIGFTPDIIVPLYKDYLISLYTPTKSALPDLAYHQSFYGSLFVVALCGVIATQILIKRNVSLQTKSDV